MGRSSLDQAGSHIISWWTRSSIRAASSWGSFDCSLPWTSSEDGCSSPLLWAARPTCSPTHSLEQCPNKMSLFGLLKDGTIAVDHIGRVFVSFPWQMLRIWKPGLLSSSITLELKRSIFKGAPSSFCTMEGEMEEKREGGVWQIWFIPISPRDKPTKRLEGVLLIYRAGSLP